VAATTKLILLKKATNYALDLAAKATDPAALAAFQHMAAYLGAKAQRLEATKERRRIRKLATPSESRETGQPIPDTQESRNDGEITVAENLRLPSSRTLTIKGQGRDTPGAVPIVS
jgi:hypothetical protein